MRETVCRHIILILVLLCFGSALSAQYYSSTSPMQSSSAQLPFVGMKSTSSASWNTSLSYQTQVASLGDNGLVPNRSIQAQAMRASKGGAGTPGTEVDYKDRLPIGDSLFPLLLLLLVYFLFRALRRPSTH